MLITFALPHSIKAQQYTIHGKITAAATHEPLESVVVEVYGTQQNCLTNSNEIFSLDCKTDSILISHIGYQSKLVKASHDAMMHIELQRGDIQLKDITVGSGTRIETHKIMTSLDINRQPLKSSQDLLRLVPGLFISQHMGGGKAEQIFLRGFDADHGTDINISVDGLPVNMVTHAHGQGYADIHFLIPETVAAYDFGKGPYYTDKGDFTTAGFVAYTTKRTLDQNMVKIEAGQFHNYRAVAMINLLRAKKNKLDHNAYIAAEGFLTDGGPFKMPENFSRYNVFGKYNQQLSQNTCMTLTASYFTSDWRTSGEIPDRAVSEGYISDQWGVLDSNQRGHTQRLNAGLKLCSNLPHGWTFDNTLWYSHYTFNLISNMSYYYYFPVAGDEFSQHEKRDMIFYNSRITRAANIGNTVFTTTAGAGLRDDIVSPLGTDHTEAGKFIGYFQAGKAHELNANSYADETIKAGRWLINIGIRADYFQFRYQDLLPQSDSATTLSTVNKTVVSPKINLMYNASKTTQLYLKAGKGFHSNDARVAVANKGFEVIPYAYGLDLGINWKPFPNLFVNSAVWYLYLQQEFTFGQDLSDQVEGAVAPSGSTSRMGIDFSTRYQCTSWLSADVNINLAHPRYVDSASGHNYIEQAPTFTSTAALGFHFKNGLNGGVGYRYLRNRAANSDYTITAHGYFITQLTVNYTRKRYELGIAIDNLLNTRWNESEIVYTSQLKNEVNPTDQISFTPGIPFFAKLKLAVFF
ncbi:TonB-dependent receptor [Taibaiella soli]|uniref:TonB-dependent receptor n=1 Tax=Taibaiella soli TaxID=1649169 RepID=UPI0014023753|nr:TonB-dependent receptor plug domain-containing protein [Taibaiella soli]